MFLQKEAWALETLDDVIHSLILILLWQKGKDTVDVVIAVALSKSRSETSDASDAPETWMRTPKLDRATALERKIASRNEMRILDHQANPCKLMVKIAEIQ